MFFQDDADFSHKLRMLPALAFVPEDAVVEAFEKLADNLPDETDAVVYYFEDTYIGRPRNRRPRLAPKFALTLWNMHKRTQDELPRTNNSVEGWHCRFQSSITCNIQVFGSFWRHLKGSNPFNRYTWHTWYIYICWQGIQRNPPERSTLITISVFGSWFRTESKAQHTKLFERHCF